MSTSGKIKGWLQGHKDSSVSFVLEKLLKTRLEPYGRLLEFKLESRLKSARIELLLHGEREPVSLDIQEYSVFAEGSGGYVVVKRATASREWLARLLQDFLIGRKLPIPENYASYVRMLL